MKKNDAKIDKPRHGHLPIPAPKIIIPKHKRKKKVKEDVKKEIKSEIQEV